MLRLDHVIHAAADRDAVVARLGLSTSTVSRNGRPARVAGFAETLADPSLPFFLQRDGVSAPHGTAGGLRWVEVGGDEARVREWVSGADLDVRFDADPTRPSGVRAVGIGDRELRTG